MSPSTRDLDQQTWMKTQLTNVKESNKAVSINNFKQIRALKQILQSRYMTREERAVGEGVSKLCLSMLPMDLSSNMTKDSLES